MPSNHLILCRPLLLPSSLAIVMSKIQLFTYQFMNIIKQVWCFQVNLIFTTISLSVFVATYFVSGEGNGTPLQYSCLENPMDGGASWAAVHGVAKSRTRLSDFAFTFHFHTLEKEMATHSSVLVWRIPGMEQPSALPSMGSHRVGHDWSNLAAATLYLRLLIFLLAILIPACASSSPEFLMMYSAYKLNKQGDNIQPWWTPFPIWNQSVVPCPVLTVASCI